ncbi:MAG: RapZ C-terminal domain-containing protein [Candidatus Dormibacteria bacterium]
MQQAQTIVITGMPGIDYEFVASILAAFGGTVHITRALSDAERALDTAGSGSTYILAIPDSNLAIGALRAPANDSFHILFLDARDDLLVSWLGVQHGLDNDAALVYIAGAREQLQRLRKYAASVLDISALSREAFEHRFRSMLDLTAIPEADRPFIRIQSFGFKYGMPTDSHMVFDARVLPNPFWNEALRGGTGEDEEVYHFVIDAPDTQVFIDHIIQFVEWTMPLYARRKQHELQIAIGCTGGQHRSVSVVIALASELKELGFPVEYIHRDLDKKSDEDFPPSTIIENA